MKCTHNGLLCAFLKLPKIDPTRFDNWLLHEASLRGNVGVLAALLRHPKVDPNCKNHDAIKTALRSRTNLISVIQTFLDEPRVDINVEEIMFDVALTENVELVRLVGRIQKLP